MNYGLNKAIAYDETGFLGHGEDAYRRQAWNFMLAGGSVFDGLDYSFSVGHEDGTDAEPNGPGGGSPEFRKELGILAKFIAGLPLQAMTPDDGAVTHAAGVTAHVLSSARGVYAIYLDGNGPTSLDLHLPPGRYRGEWLNTGTGESRPVAAFQAGAVTPALQSPTFTNGIALRLTRDLY